MNSSIQTIPFANLALAFVPVAGVIFILWRWGLAYRNALYAVFRMLLQLLLVGYFLAYIFESDSAVIVVAVLVIMLMTSSWIALRMVHGPRRTLYFKSLASIAAGGGIVLILVTQGVLNLEPWYEPSRMIPLAGIIFANGMNSVSLAAERFSSEIGRDASYTRARSIAYSAALIPIINSLFAVGLVSLPGTMTGQILSGVSPFIAARYQIMVMCMVFSSAGLSSALFLTLIKPDLGQESSLSSDQIVGSTLADVPITLPPEANQA